MGTLSEDLIAIKSVEDTLIANKVARFSYTDTAYADNDANGVDTYNVNNEQNIPNPSASILKVNSTVLDRGYRAQASSITRMLVNHFFGRVSYNLNKINDNMSNLIATLRAHAGTANGFATLDSNGRIPYSQLPESAVELKGYWNASTNTPTLADGTGTNGDEYFVDTAGSQDLGSGTQYFKVGDRVVYTGGIWKNIDSGAIRTINGETPNSQGERSIVFGNNLPITRTLCTALFSNFMGSVWKKSESSAVSGVCILDPTFANGIWVAGSGNNKGVYWSEDGKNWTKGTGASAEEETALSNVSTQYPLYTNNMWIISSMGGGMWWSNDGKVWNQGAIVEGESISYFGKSIYINGLYLVSALTKGVYWSEDGKNWNQGNIDTTNLSDNASIYYAGGIYFCRTTYINGSTLTFRTYSSTDGKSWTQVFSTYGIVGIIYREGLWVMATSIYSGSGAGVFWSEDGVNWTLGTSGDTNCIVYAFGKYIAGRKTGIYYSSDGKSWSQATSDLQGLNTATIEQICFGYNIYGEPMLVATGTSTAISSNGSYWSGVNLNTSDFFELININGKWLTETVFNNNGKLSIFIKISEDGLTWRSIQNIPNNTTVNSGSTGNKKAITYANGILMPDVSMDGVYSAIEDIFAEGIISAPIPRIINA